MTFTDADGKKRLATTEELHAMTNAELKEYTSCYKCGAHAPYVVTVDSGVEHVCEIHWGEHVRSGAFGANARRGATRA